MHHRLALVLGRPQRSLVLSGTSIQPRADPSTFENFGKMLANCWPNVGRRECEPPTGALRRRPGRVGATDWGTSPTARASESLRTSATFELLCGRQAEVVISKLYKAHSRQKEYPDKVATRSLLPTSKAWSNWAQNCHAVAAPHLEGVVELGSKLPRGGCWQTASFLTAFRNERQNKGGYRVVSNRV